jgi:hypothetical protein
MERILVMPARRLIFCVAMASITAGCFDVRTVDPGRWLIDDFEAPNGFPTDRSFERWGCQPLDEDHPIDADGCNRVLDPGPGLNNGNHVLHLAAALYPNEGIGTFTRAEVATHVPAARILDLRPYDQFLFSWRLVFEPEAEKSLSSPKDNLNLIAQLVCTTARSQDGGVPNKPFIVHSIPYTFGAAGAEEWNTRALPSFSTPEFSQNAPEVQDCLARVDGIKITVDSTQRPVLPNHKVNFDLYIDDISLHPKE